MLAAALDSTRPTSAVSNAERNPGIKNSPHRQGTGNQNYRAPGRSGGVKATPVEIRALDLFCGAGGSSWGAREAGVEIVAAFDLWPLAGEAHDANFPEVEFISGRLEEHDIEALVKRLGKIDFNYRLAGMPQPQPGQGQQAPVRTEQGHCVSGRALCRSVQAPLDRHRERG